MRKVLAIDDKHDNLVTISAFIKTYIEDCEVILAQSGPEGLEKARQEQPDTIILDIKMPDMDGFEVCTRLKADDTTKHIPVILLTAIKTDVDSRIKGLEMGADAFLTKPIDEAELTAQINVMLRIKKSEDLLREERDLLEEEVQKRTMALQQSQSALKKEQDFIKSLHDATPAYFIAMDEKGTISFMNRALYQLLGASPHHEPKPFIDFIAPQDQSLTENHINKLWRNEEVVPFESRLLLPHNDYAYVEWHGRTFCSLQNTTEFVFFVGIDITKRKQLEKTLANANDAERSKIGRDLHDGLGQHLAGTIFKSELLKLKLEEKNAPEAEDLNEIITMVADAINKTRDLARGLCPVNIQEGGILGAIETLCAETRERNGTNCIIKSEGTVTTNTAPEASNLYYIAREAINNACRHGKAQNIIVRISGTEDSITLTVTDDGSGFDMTSTSGKGTGLSIMQYRSWIIGAALSVQPNSGGGTVVTCILSRSGSKEQPESQFTSSADYTRDSSADTHKILVVDDHPIVRQGLTQIINREPGLAVCGEAQNADEAIKLVAQLEPHVVTVDISLGGTSGMDLVKALKSRYPGLPMLMLSIYDESIYAERAISVGARGYVMKQEPPATIINAVKTLADGKQYFSETVKEKFIDKYQYENVSKTRLSVDSLTNREFEIFQLIGQGMGNKHIAEKLSISIKTVENYRERIKNKLNLNSSQDVVQFAVQWVLHHSK